jgi:ATP/maltotriose-dependent transcriptional regulator MalT
MNGIVQMQRPTPEEEDGVVQAKLIPPIPHRNLVARDNLLLKLHRSVANFPVTLISAPAGYGKTSLVSVFCRSHDELAIAWRDMLNLVTIKAASGAIR